MWFWSALLDRSGDRFADFVLATFLTTGEMGLLGAIITYHLDVEHGSERRAATARRLKQIARGR